MEWLSHSQKKHCELCKTPFRFTKLYDPNMPQSLPTHIFVSHTTKYLFRKLLLWMRAGLVVNVWLGWLPYLMRSVWSFLFWLSDEGLGGRPSLLGLDVDLLTTYGTNVCPSSPLFAATTTVSTIGGVINNLPPDSARLVKGLYGINLTLSDPVYSTILRILFGTTDQTTAVNATTTRLPETPNHGSLLSGVGFLGNLTRHSAVNRAVIAILEGQIITVLVIVCFILIILVRDYVVQQQPEINMRAAFAAAENQQPGLLNPAQLEVEARDIFEGAPHDGADEIADSSDETTSETLDYQPETPAESSSRPLLPSIVPPDLAQARPMQDFDRTTVHEYLDIYRAAGGDPEKILELARERQLEVRLDYWMRLTRSMMDRRREIMNPDTQAGPSRAEHESDAGDDSASKPSEAADAKGKGKLVEDQPEDKLIEDIQEAVRHPIGNPLRPRANTDGPPISNAINPLANNSWSFADLPNETFSPWTPELPVPADPLREASGSWSPHIPDPEEDGDLRWDTPESSEMASRPPSSLGPEPPHLDVGPNVLPAQPPRQAAPPRPPRPDPEGLVGRVADFMWREVDDIDDADLAPVNFLGDFGEDNLDEEPQGNALPNPPDRDREVAEAAAAAGLDAEAIEDAEDLEGILELLGMRGPVAGLFQNAIFCAFLVSITIFVGVFIPYNLGRLAIWGLANPMRIARILFSFSKFVQDCALLTLGLCGSTIAESVRVLSRAFMLKPVAEYSQGMVNASWTMAVGAANRIGGSFVTELPLISAAEMRNFSAISHEALLSLKEHIALTFSGLWGLLAFLFSGDYTLKGAATFGVNILATVWDGLKGLPTAIANPSSWVLDLSLPESTGPINPALASWSGSDRFWAILAGYLAMSLIAGLYLRRGTPFSTTQAARDWEASLIDGLKQASGVMKVILIISIEMLVFPLYCGMLLDLALLPLFEDVTIKSRLLFTINYPITSIFVHWFIGTGYMFHFALFVSMCRKIMRKGVLYFIRDPDDPEFHPVRDVLERSVATQLRKILFSAFVYGALVVVCLGGVVWGLYLSLSNVLPIHYSSNEPVLEFPIDLLFYNFLMPFAVRFFKPASGLHAMYTWWFRRCARALRITWFLFGERRIDEEGHLVLKPDSPDRQLPFWRQAFLEIDGSGHVVARSWRGIFEGGTAKRPTVKKEHMMLYNVRKSNLVQSGQLISDGRFVRSPASDQVKIPKGVSVFLDVNENNTRRDDLPDRDTDLYSSKQYQLVYVPPHFRVRIFLFILFIWIFAAVTGVSITIVPLVFGRWMFKRLIPGHIRSNDVYAFSIGIHILGSAAYALFHARSIYGAAKERLGAVAETVLQRDGVRRVFGAVALTTRVIYTYFFVLVVFPLFAASLMELYALIPLHEVMYGATLDKHGGKPNKVANPVHTIRVIQAWTIGLLYLKLALRITNTWFRGSRMSNAARAVLRRGWLDPDVSILTRSFIIPAVAVWLAAVATPLLLARSTIAHGLADTLVAASGPAPDGALPDPALRDAYLVLIYRLSFPLMALAIVSGITLWSVVGVFRTWQVRIRDEAYLIGERLHNFGGTNAPRPRAGAWRAGAARI
jgi:E3 ubiquitin-protein ligase MARCH6